MTTRGYDQWRAASPYDYEPDLLAEIDKLLAKPEPKSTTDLEHELIRKLRGLREILREETGI